MLAGVLSHDHALREIAAAVVQVAEDRTEFAYAVQPGNRVAVHVYCSAVLVVYWAAVRVQGSLHDSIA